MDEHKCVVGFLLDQDDFRFVDLDQLKDHIKEVKAINRSLKKMKIHTDMEEYSLLDYASNRRATDLARFEFCPKCGKKIDWGRIGRMRDA